MYWKLYIDSPQEKALKLCRGSYTTGDGIGYGRGAGDGGGGGRGNSDDYGFYDGDGFGGSCTGAGMPIWAGKSPKEWK